METFFRLPPHSTHLPQPLDVGCVWRLLVIDGFGSHLSYEFYHYDQVHKIELFRLPPHSSPPLDVGCFQPFKHHHAEGLDVRDGGVDYNKLDFLAMFRRKAQIALDRAIAAENRKLQEVINAEKNLWKNMFKGAKSVLIAHKKFQVNRHNFHGVICR